MTTFTELREAYTEDTVGRKYHVPIVSKREAKPANADAGPLRTLNLNKPMNKEQFAALPANLKRDYIVHLITEHGARRADIANMLGYSTSAFSYTCTNLGIPRPTHKPKQASEEWKAFISGYASAEAAPVEEEIKDSKTTSAACKTATVTFEDATLDEVVRSLSHLTLGQRVKSISVSVEV
jgi:hypothetical protein